MGDSYNENELLRSKGIFHFYVAAFTGRVWSSMPRRQQIYSLLYTCMYPYICRLMPTSCHVTSVYLYKSQAGKQVARQVGGM